MKKFFVIIAAIIVVVVIFLIIFQPRKKKAEVYEIGAIFSVTGPASWLGEPEKSTAVMVEDMINQNGGINGVPVDIIVEDTEGDPTKGVNAVKKLINRDQVLAVVGPSRSGTSLAVVPIVQKAQVPLVSCAAAEKIVKPVKKWVFQTPQLDRHAVEKIYEYMNDQGITRIAILSGTTGFGSAGREQLKLLAPEYGIEILADETYGPSDTDMTSQLTKIRGLERVQGIVNWSIVPAQVIVAKNMVQLGIDIPLFLSHGFGNIKYVEAAGEAAEGIIFPAGRLLVAEQVSESHPQKEVLMKYKNRYESRFNEPVSTFGGHAWDALWIVHNAIKRAGADRAAIRDAIENHTRGFVGTGGVFTYTQEDHNGLTSEAFEMLVVKNGEFTILRD
ncbi:MAG: ABC transporter substrate-binding protein [Spirochaetota bacterium]